MTNIGKSEAELVNIARALRRDVLEMIYDVKDGHPGPAYSAMDIITAIYFSGEMNFKPDQPNWPERDRFVLSKGHACPALYAALIRLGVLNENEKLTLRKIGTRLQGHPEMAKTPGIEATTGPLGNGLGMAVGMAKALKLQKTAARVYVLTGDGELQEGIVWEALMAAVKHRLNNLCIFVDANGRQSGGPVADVGGLLPIAEKMQSFRLATRSIDGHSFPEIIDSLKWAREQTAPAVIVCNTIKGKGLDFMEDDNSWHKRTPSEDEYLEGMKQLAGGEK